MTLLKYCTQKSFFSKLELTLNTWLFHSNVVIDALRLHLNDVSSLLYRAMGE